MRKEKKEWEKKRVKKRLKRERIEKRKYNGGRWWRKTGKNEEGKE